MKEKKWHSQKIAYEKTILFRKNFVINLINYYIANLNLSKQQRKRIRKRVVDNFCKQNNFSSKRTYRKYESEYRVKLNFVFLRKDKFAQFLKSYDFTKK